jgi:Ni/Co efflux regulator RcnB
LAAGGQAWAKDHHDRDGGGRGEQRGGNGNGRWGGGERGGERGGPPPGYGRGGEAPPGYGRGGEGPPGWRGGEAPPGYRGDPRGDPRYEQRGYERGYERGYAPPPQSYGPPRRGGYLGPQGGAPIEDPRRFGLREPPRGYRWVRVPGGMAIVSESTGQVFDVVPDGR